MTYILQLMWLEENEGKRESERDGRNGKRSGSDYQKRKKTQ